MNVCIALMFHVDTLCVGSDFLCATDATFVTLMPLRYSGLTNCTRRFRKTTISTRSYLSVAANGTTDKRTQTPRSFRCTRNTHRTLAQQMMQTEHERTVNPQKDARTRAYRNQNRSSGECCFVLSNSCGRTDADRPKWPG